MKLKRKGFTLIEIMIVVAIIALLAAIAIPNFVKYRNRARVGACVANRTQIARAAESYIMEYNIDMTAFAGYGASTIAGYLAPADGTGYIKEFPSCPSAGTYTYTESNEILTVACSEGDHPDVTAAGE